MSARHRPCHAGLESVVPVATIGQRPAPAEWCCRIDVMNASRLIDYTPQLKITNLDILPHGTGARFLIVACSPYPNEYIAKKWARKLPRSVSNAECVVRFA